MPHVATEFPVEAYRLRTAPGRDEIFIQAPTWAINTKRAFSMFAPDLNGVNDRARARVLRDICCASGAADESEKLCRDPDMVTRMENPKRKHPVMADGTLDKAFRGKSRTYYAHLDLSVKRDSTGLAVAHMEGKGKKSRVVIDLMLERKVPAGGVLRFKDTREILYELTRRGFWFKKVTADGFQSSETMQELEEHGIKSGLYSVDRNMQAYDTLYELLSGGRLDYYRYEPFIRNWNSLIVIGGKRVDHMPEAAGGAKDVSDAVAAVCVHCMEGKEGSVDFL